MIYFMIYFILVMLFPLLGFLYDFFEKLERLFVDWAITNDCFLTFENFIKFLKDKKLQLLKFCFIFLFLASMLIMSVKSMLFINLITINESDSLALVLCLMVFVFLFFFGWRFWKRIPSLELVVKHELKMRKSLFISE